MARASFAWDNQPNPLARTLRTLFDTRVLRVARVISTTDGPGPSLGYAGPPDGITKLLKMIDRQRERMGADTLRHDRADVRAGRIFAARELPDADLVAVTGTPAQLAALPAGPALLLPYRLHALVETGDPAWRGRVSRSERQWAQPRIARQGLRIEQAYDDASFGFFFDRVHLPTMRNRHGDRARSESRLRAYEGLFRPGALLFVTNGRQRLAGALASCSADGRRLTPRLGGVLEGSAQLHSAGMLRLLYFLLLDWAERQGVARVDLSGVEAWVASGLYGYKRRFSPQLEPPPDHRANLAVWWHARRDTPQVRDFLVRNPVLERTGAGTLRAVYFHDLRRPARHDIPFACANVRERRDVDLDDFLADVPTGVDIV
ncbi:hypothetical protein AB0M35_26105 [Micromonospora sp. NPDC051196]|uniref:hypothetical protein n=1 Tax=Micromonospora sp. NPDC051196 TaxID=3155281 RepID=UPI0034195457